FDNDADDMILFVQTGARVAKPLNVGRARSRGHEFDLSLGMGRAAGLTLAYTVQTATNLSPYPDYHNKELPGRPAQELHATFTYGRPGWNAAWTLTHRTAFYLDQANNPVRRVPAHSIHGLRLGLASPAKGTRLDLELDNLGNEQYADEYGFPVPGRAIYMTISMDSPARP
ncbi:MAG: TonB-dependent receptor, partial [Deltaproteobacteria bacterium]